MIKKLLLSRILLSGLCFGFTTQVMAEESIATPDNIETKKIGWCIKKYAEKKQIEF